MSQSAVELILAGLPMVAIVVLLLLRVRPLHAVLIVIVATLALSPWFPVTSSALQDSVGSLSFSVLSAVLIMLGGIVLSEFLSTSGAQNRISEWLSHAAGTRERSVLLLGLGIAPLAESVIGFGVGVITTVPLLLRTGLSPTRAAAVSLLGIILAPWGSMGPGLLITTGMSGVGLSELGVWSAVLNFPVQCVMGAAIGAVGLGTVVLRRYIAEILVATVAMWLVLVATNAWVTPALGGILASFAGIIVFIALARLRGGPRISMDSATRQSFSPYASLVVVMAAATGFAGVVDLGSWEKILTGPALWIMVIAMVAPLMLGMTRSEIPAAVERGTRMWFPVCTLTLLYIVFGALLSMNGMSSRLAEEATDMGSAFLFLIPAIGAVSGYVTNSGSASAALVTVGITEASHSLGTDTATALAMQNVATGAAIMMCPARVAVAAGVADSLRGECEDTVDTRWIMKVVLAANAVVVGLLTVLVAVVLT